MALSKVHYLTSFTPDFQWQRFVKETPGVPEDEALIDALWQLARPQVVWREGCITSRQDCQLTIDGGEMAIDSAYVSQGLAQCERVSVMALTIGPHLPETASQLLAEGELYRGTIADLLGSYGAERLAEDFCAHLSQQALPKGLYATLRFSPGYGDWSLSGQTSLLGYLACPQLGVRLTDNFMLEPVKSITAVVGWAPSWQKPVYPEGIRGSGFCNGGHNCAACVTWACRKQHYPRKDDES